MPTAHNGRTNLLDLPDELLSSCLPWDDQSFRACKAVCKRILGLLLMGNSSAVLGLELRIHELEQVSDRRASLQLMCRLFPKLQRLNVVSRSLLRNQLAYLLAVPQDNHPLGWDWLQGITRMHLGSHHEGEHLLLPHPVTSHVAMACPQLKELTLTGVTICAQDQWVVDSRWWEQGTGFEQLMGAYQGIEVAFKGLQQQSEQLAREAMGTDQATVMRCHNDAAVFSSHFQHTVKTRTQLLMLAPQEPQTDEPAPPASLQHLKKLSLHSCPWENSASALQQQLQLLPSLQELHMTGCYSTDSRLTLECASTVADIYNGQLLCLVWDNWRVQEAITPLLSKPWAQLQQLQLSCTTVDDTTMELLLQQAPGLKSVHVSGFRLQHDFSRRFCSWETVIFGDSVALASLARLPLSKETALCVSDHVKVCIGSTEGSAGGVASTPSAAAAIAAAAAAAIVHCGGIHPERGKSPGYVEFCTFLDQACIMTQVALCILPLLGQITHTSAFWGVHITRGLLNAINKHLPHCSHARFGIGCTFDSDIWGSMVSLLPNVTELTVLGQDATLHQVKELCAAANHPTTLHLEKDQFDYQYEANDADANWQEELRVAALGMPINFIFF